MFGSLQYVPDSVLNRLQKYIENHLHINYFQKLNAVVFIKLLYHTRSNSQVTCKFKITLNYENTGSGVNEVC